MGLLHICRIASTKKEDSNHPTVALQQLFLFGPLNRQPRSQFASRSYTGTKMYMIVCAFCGGDISCRTESNVRSICPKYSHPCSWHSTISAVGHDCHVDLLLHLVPTAPLFPLFFPSTDASPAPPLGAASLPVAYRYRCSSKNHRHHHQTLLPAVPPESGVGFPSSSVGSCSHVST